MSVYDSPAVILTLREVPATSTGLKNRPLQTVIIEIVKPVRGAM